MSERPDTPLASREPPGGTDVATGTDGDLRVDWIALFVVALAALLVGAAAICWAFFGAELRRLTSLDPRPSPIEEQSSPVIPPEPRLQTSPPADMARYLEEQNALLGSWGWADEQAGTVRVPIDRAIDLVVEKKARAAMTGDEAPSGGAK